jgi:uncharacterized protein (TIGR03086 family)
MTELSDTAGAQHARFAARFSTVMEGVSDWDAPTPVAEWRARDVVGHLVTWLPGFLSGGGVIIPEADLDDLAGSWRRQTTAVQGLLDDPEASAADFTHPRLLPQPLGQVLSAFYVADIFMHTWDLARASSQEYLMEPDYAEGLLGGLRSMEQVIRASGQFGQQHPVADDAPLQDQLIAFIGRDPSWQRTG